MNPGKLHKRIFSNDSFGLRVVDSNRKLYIAHEIRKLFGLDFTCVDVSDIMETGSGCSLQ